MTPPPPSPCLSFPFQPVLLTLLLCTTITTTVAQSPAPSPASPGPTNITKILEKASQFTTLIRLFAITDVGDQINTQLNNSEQGMTVFAPTDNAFSALSSGTINSLSEQQKDELVQFHVIPTFISESQFQTLSNPLRTQAGDSTFYNFPLNITTSGNNAVNLTTGVVNASVANEIYSDGSLAVYEVDKVLLPMALFGPQPPAAAPTPESGEEKKKKSSDGGDDTPATSAANSSGREADLRLDLHGFMAGLFAFVAMFYL